MKKIDKKLDRDRLILVQFVFKESCLPEDFALAADSVLEGFNWCLVGDNAIQARIVGKFEIMTSVKLRVVGQQNCLVTISDHFALDMCLIVIGFVGSVAIQSAAAKEEQVCMEIIDEVEPVKRGIFGGAVGYLGWHGEMDMSIAIRTCVIRENKVYVQAGAGLVADSNPESEWNETQIKARAVIKAVELSSNGLIL